MPSPQTVVREIAIALLFILLSVAMTWPLAVHLDTASAGPGDPYLLAWTLEWDARALTSHPLSLFHPPVFHPARYALAFSEHIVGIALFGIPLFALGLSALAVHNVLMIAGFAGSGWAAYVLSRLVTRSTWAAIAGGIFFAFVPFRFTHMAHLQHVWSMWLPLLLAALLHWHRDPSNRRAVLFGLAFFFNGLTNVHWLLFGSTATFFAAVLLAATWQPRTRKAWAGLAAATCTAAAALLPFLLPYRKASELYGMVRSRFETQWYSAHLTDWLVPGRLNRFYGHLTDSHVMEERHLFPGILAVLLAIAGLLLARRTEPASTTERGIDNSPRRILLVLDLASTLAFVLALLGSYPGTRKLSIGSLTLFRYEGWTTAFAIALGLLLIRFWIRLPVALGGIGRRSARDFFADSRLPSPIWCAILWVVMGLWGSLGLNGLMHTLLFEHVEPFQGLRVPARWAMIAYTGLAVLVSWGVATIQQHIEGAGRRQFISKALPGLACILLLAELRAAPIPWHLMSPGPLPVYSWLATIPARGAVLELPLGEGGFEHNWMMQSAVHRKPLVNGVSGFSPPDHDRLIGWMHETPISPKALDYLERIECSLVIVHTDLLGKQGAAVRAWLTAGLESGRLTFVRRFDERIRGVWVFAITRVESSAAAWRAPELPDPSGRTPMQSLDAYLADNAFTYNGSPFGMVDVPATYQVAGRGLTVSGWAVAPAGVREVRLRFGTGRVVVPAELTDRPDVNHGAFPWYPATVRAGFARSFEQRPRSLDRVTDLQVEIVDGAGRSVRLDPVVFRWLDQPQLDPADWRIEALGALLARSGRDPEIDGRALLARTLTIWDIGDSVVESTEERPDNEFLDHAFQVLLGRPPDRAATSKYLVLLREGMHREEIVELLIHSDEFARVHLRPGARVPPRG